jgi:S1-C subfamily serine protease
VNLLDLAIALLLVLAAINGFRRGALLQLCTYAGLLIGLVLGALLAPAVAHLASSTLGQATVALVALFSLAALGDAVGWLVGLRVWRLAHRTVLGTFDSVAGTVVALVAVLVTTWFLGWNLVNGPFPSVSEAIRGSAAMRTLDDVFPRPPSVLAEVRQFLNRFGFPEVFVDLPPAPAGPVDAPSDAEVARIAKLAEASTVRIVGEACGAIQEGSGFVAADHYVITNAHVVAGVKAPLVQRQNVDGSLDAIVVVFDPKLDIAVLYVEDPPGPVLDLDGHEEDRGSQGAVLGYPGGGSLKEGAGAVLRTLDAVGRDIYGQKVVERQVYELQAIVRPGNSGGPFVLADGTVAGVVFAASTVDKKVGYAITSPQVVPELRDAQGKAQAVSTGGCVR